MRKARGALVDDVLLAGAAETEHHEIAVYEGLITHAYAMGKGNVVDLLRHNLEQEQHTLAEVKRVAEKAAAALGSPRAVSRAGAAPNGGRCRYLLTWAILTICFHPGHGVRELPLSPAAAAAGGQADQAPCQAPRTQPAPGAHGPRGATTQARQAADPARRGRMGGGLAFSNEPAHQHERMPAA